MNLIGWRDVVWYLNLAAIAVLLLQLFLQRLVASYPFLFAYFLADLAQTILGLWFVTPGAYLYIYVVGQSLKTVLAVGVVLELYRLTLERHPALAKFGQRAAGYLLVLLGAMAALGLYLGPPVPPDQRPLLSYCLTFERTMDSSLVVFLVVLSLFLAWFPVRVRRNAAIYIGGFASYFLARWAMAWATTTWPGFRSPLNVAQLSFSLVCLLAWIALMRREGETQQVVTGRHWNPEEMERLTGKLSAINARLMRIN
jgi:hypothetical protein